MMKRAPCFNTCPSNANASDVVARVKVLENSLTSYMKLQTDEMKRLSLAVGSLAPPPRVPLARPRLESVGKKHKLDEDIEEVFEDVRHNPTWPNHQNTNQQNINNQKPKEKTFATVAQTEPKRDVNQRNTNSQNMGNRSRRPSTLLFGKAKTGKDDVENFLAANVNLVATGVAKDATSEQLKEFIVNKGINVVEIELLTQHPEARTNTFRIAIKPSDYDRAMNPDVWPYRVGVRIFRQKRAQHSWNNQSGQAGGNVQPGHPQGDQHRGNQHHQGQDRHSQHRQNQQQPQGIETHNGFAALDTEAGRQFGN